MGNETKDKIKELQPLVKELAKLDGEVKKDVNTSVKGAGARLGEDSSGGSENVKELLQGGHTTLKLLCGTQINSRKCPSFLHRFLSKALENIIEIGAGSERGAGAIYLHNWQHDELVMCASYGFPINPGDKEDRKEPAWVQALLNENKKKKIHVNIHDKVSKIKYINDELAPKLRKETVERHPWVQQLLKVDYSGCHSGDNGNVDRNECDCNKALIGVAYYRPGRGITGQLFHPEQGPRLERPAYDEEFMRIYNRRIDKLGELKDHLEKTLLRKWTVVYKARQDMSSGRQVRAGLYEGLQFPGSKYIGPFMGTVLRFNGENLGVLKIEKHRLPKDGGSSANRIRGFSGENAADLIVFSYALAGVLYLLKHYAGFDLTTAWTGADVVGGE